MERSIYRNYIDEITPYEPGKPIEEVERELGISNVVKLASNENPLGPSRKALRAIRHVLQKIHRYPDGGSFYLKQKLSHEFGVSTDQLILGNGSNEIIELLTRGFLGAGDRVIASEMSFLVYPILTKVCGGEFVAVPMKDFRYDLKGILNRIDERTRLIFIANPNNPTGSYVTNDEVEDFLSKVPRDVIVCFDEAYYDFVNASDFPYTLFHVKANKPNVILLRTFSKSYGLAGLRIGYGIANARLISYLNKIRQPFNINLLAQVAASAALDDKRFLWRTRRLIQREKLYLYRKFEQFGIHYIPTQANFILFDTGCDTTSVFEALLKRGVIVRVMKAYGLSNHIRVTIGKRSENRALIRALRQVLKLKKSK
ncbi:MAG: histidinol-phosphate transaminase [Candidatus Omnitrophica bacterium]|nr:histidinol-phosphate transaminase [Candidatus Omnitrophota bacterium]